MEKATIFEARTPQRVILLAAALCPVATAGAQTGGGTQTLCVLDFNRLGDDSSMDWLSRGLSDMMITTWSRVGSFQLVEREHLRQLLAEHDLVTSGLIDEDTAIKQGRLAKAQFLLTGQFAIRDQALTIDVRLLRIDDQQIVAVATWTGPSAHVLAAPQNLSEQILTTLGQPLDPEKLKGIEREIPQTIDVAQAYYLGVEDFDHGKYPDALAHYLDGADSAGEFLKIYHAIIRLYYLLEQHEHAVVFAAQTAAALESEQDIVHAVEFYFKAAKRARDPLQNEYIAIHMWSKLITVAERYEVEAQEQANTKQQILEHVAQLQRKQPTRKLMEPDRWLKDQVRVLVWGLSNDSERWVHNPVEPSTYAWKTRARIMPARRFVRTGQIDKALNSYKEVFEEYKYLTKLPLEYYHRLLDGLKTEAHFMLLYHYKKTGQLHLDHAFGEINKVNSVSDGAVFTRDFKNPAMDPRAKNASRYANRGYEYFSFAAPAGQQIDSVTLTAKVRGIASFSFAVPDPQGWPPQFDLSKRIDHYKFSMKGTYKKKITFPPGNQLVSIGTAWGKGLYSNTPAELIKYKMFGPSDGKDIKSWRATFSVSPAKAHTTIAHDGVYTEADDLLMKFGAHQDGWRDGHVIRPSRATYYSGQPPQDVFAQQWLVFSLEGQIHIFDRDNPKIGVELPTTINTDENEFNPCLVRTRRGELALLWSRGNKAETAGRFMSVTRDFLHWSTPQRMTFEEPGEDLHYTYARSEPLERSYNVVATPEGYLMLLAQGHVRYSKDLKCWGRPRKILPHNALANRVTRTADGTLWAVFQNHSDERRPYTPGDRMAGFYVIDGKKYKHMCEVQIAQSRDGKTWQTAEKVVIPGTASCLWAFPVSPTRIGIAVQFNSRFMKWFASRELRKPREVRAQVQLMNNSQQAEFFITDNALHCWRPVFDHFGEQVSVLLETTDEQLYQRFMQ